MQNSVRLEGFDAPAVSARILPFDSGDDFAQIAPEVAPEPILEPELIADPNPDETAEAAEAEALQSLATTLAAISNHVDKLHAGLSEDLSAAIGDAVLKSLPSVLEEGFAAEIAEVTQSILGRITQTHLQLKIAPLHHDHVVAAFAGLAPTVPVEIIDDDTLNPGQARLEWASGGADFDADDWSEAARTTLKRHLEHLSTRRRDDD
jgi:hypothetical protein